MKQERLKRELEHVGEESDSVQQGRGHKMFNITEDTGELLAVLMQSTG